MKKQLNYLAFIILLLFSACSVQESETDYSTKTATEEGYTYEYVSGDPMKTRIYTLDNGLKVYLSVYTDAPRAQVYIPVKAGGKNDPGDNTGLAHYLEHMMFKGTDKFGTLDYEKEVVLLDSIENLFQQYATLEDPAQRQAHYTLIDEVSNEAAKYAIPNEYDKLMAGIGGKGLNAYTTTDRTVYTVDIPTNEIEKFLEIEGSRFRKIVNRLFHTELEAVYEEKNRSLDNDGWKSYEAMAKLAFEKHPYGTQTVIGTIEHLKNPSIAAIKNYFDKYYKPNNVAICISGDIDFNKTIKTIDQYFGSWEPNDNLEPWIKIEEEPIAAPRVKEIYGPDADNISLAFRFGGLSDPDYTMVELIDMMLANSEAGLIDLNLVQKQKVLGASSYLDGMNDYSLHTLTGEPKEGQTLEDVQTLLLDQIEHIKKGEFEDWLIEAVITDLKKSEMVNLEKNWARANKMVMAFTNDMDWGTYISRISKMEKITKQEVIDFVKKHYGNNYLAVYKRNGEDPNKLRVEKPNITKVPLNKEQKSPFHEAILAKESPKLKPVFVDYNKDISNGQMKGGIEVLSLKNNENELFDLYYLLDIGSNNDPTMKVAVEYLEYLGTGDHDAESLKKQFYKLGCSINVTATSEKTYVSLNGLNENMGKALVLFEQLLANPKPDQEALNDLIGRLLKTREDSKKNKGKIMWSGLMSYAEYGPKSPFTNVLSNADLQNLEAQDLVDKIKDIMTMKHRILYYGPLEQGDLITTLNKHHNVPENLKPVPEQVEFAQIPTDESKVYWTHYDMVQTEFILLSRGDKYNASLEPDIRLFNEYFGESIVFQEIREAQGLAYSAFASYDKAAKADQHDQLLAYIGTQADKQSESMKAIKALLDEMPESETGFEIARQAILNKIESERITKSQILWNYESAKNKNLDYDIRKDVYEKVKTMSFNDLKAFQEKYIKNKPYITVLIGNREKINFNDLQKYGEVQELSLEELFGYSKVEHVDLEME